MAIVFGRIWEVRHYALLSIIALLTSCPYFSFVFTTGHLDYRCKIPICDHSTDTRLEYSPDWLQFAVPFRDDGKPASCQRFQHLANDRALSCDVISFNRSMVENCDEFVFAPGELTIVNEFNITCQDKEWQLALVGSLGYMAEMLVLPLFAVLSDKYGRRPILIVNVLFGGVFGLIKSVSINYIMFATMEFLTACVSGGTFMTVFIMAIESATPSHRVLSATIISIMFPLSQVLTGLLAIWVPNFRTLLQILYLPNVIIMSFIWVIPESDRWLVTNGKAEKAKQIITNKAVNTNGITFSKDDVLDREAENPKITLATPPDAYAETFLNILRSRVLLIRLVVNISIWFMIKLVYYGMTFQSVALVGNKHVNYIAVSGAALPSKLISLLLMNSLGRKWSLCVTLLLTGVACVGTQWIPDSVWLASLLVYMFGKCCVATAFSILYVYTSEMFPTSLRHRTMNTCYSIGMIAATLAPFTMLLVSVLPSLPLFVFGSAAFICGTLVLALPETLNTKLPNTIAEAEQLVAVET